MRWRVAAFLADDGVSCLVVVHVAQVVLAGWNNFRTMVSGYEVQRVEAPSLEAERKSWR